MIPKIIHYCWFGKGTMPELVQTCIASWHTYMPDWEYRLWDEASLSQTLSPLKGGEDCWLDIVPPYVKEAYEARKFAFVSDYVRLWALEREGGVYLDTDVEVLRSFDTLLNDTAFIGLEESLALLPGTCVMGCEAHCQWVQDMLSTYNNTHFLHEDGTMDMTTNVQRLGKRMVEGGLQHERKNQYLSQWGLRVYTHDYFSPITSTRVMRKSKNTYCIHRFAGSWIDGKKTGIRDRWIVRETINILVQVKRKLRLGIKGNV
jgi:mannosyltransferase OCH1-like enzyme